MKFLVEEIRREADETISMYKGFKSGAELPPITVKHIMLFAYKMRFLCDHISHLEKKNEK